MKREQLILDIHQDANFYINKCWELRHHYKREEEKILYFAGTLFASIVFTVGVLDISKEIALGTLTIYHLLVFHSVFFILLLFYLYKQLNADVFHYLAIKGELFLDEKTRHHVIKGTQLPSFSEIKGKYINNKEKKLSGIRLMLAANYLIVAVYIVITIVPFFLTQSSINQNGLQLSWTALLTTSAFVICLIYIFRYKSGQKKKICEQIERDWEDEKRIFDEKIKLIDE